MKLRQCIRLPYAPHVGATLCRRKPVGHMESPNVMGMKAISIVSDWQSSERGDLTKSFVPSFVPLPLARKWVGLLTKSAVYKARSQFLLTSFEIRSGQAQSTCSPLNYPTFGCILVTLRPSQQPDNAAALTRIIDDGLLIGSAAFPPGITEVRATLPEEG